MATSPIFVADAERRELWVDGRRHTIAPKPFDVLVHLVVRNRHRVVTRDELLDTVWNEAGVSPEVIAQAIAKIRQAMRRSKTHAVRIQTVYGRGFRLLADMRAEPADDAVPALLSDLHRPQLGFERGLQAIGEEGHEDGASTSRLTCTPSRAPAHG